MADPAAAADAAEEPQAEQVPLPRLPDEMLLEVLQHLDVNSRLRCRLVSHHLNDVALKSLTSLTVHVYKIEEGSRAVGPLRKLIRGASSLKRIELNYSSSGGVRMLNLVKYLAGHPSLTSLRVYSKSNLSKLCSNVAAALPELPALEELDLDMVGHYRGGPHPSLSSRQELVQAIRPHTTPHLSRLLVRFARPLFQQIKENDHCLHNWLHSESVQEMLAVNRGLRLRLTISGTSWGSYYVDSPCCKFCLLGCHSRPYEPDPSLSWLMNLKTYEFSYLSFRDSNSSA